MKNSPDVISELNQNEIFVFGSNVNGKHCSGAARIAFDKFGAIWGKGVGVQGNSYAIPTMEGNMQVLYAYICDFIEYARTHPKKIFLVTRIGCGIAGYKDEQIAPMFANALNIQNILLPRSFMDVLLPFQKKQVPEYYHYNGMKYCKDMVCHMTFSKKLEHKDFVFFWKEYDDKPFVTKKCLSQWYYAPFFVDNQWYSCAEQFMMAEKARLFGDFEILQRIIEEPDQQSIKKLGRMVRNFNEDVWLQHRYEIIKRGNIAKFGQNEDLRKYLLATGSKILVEASPHDVIYGVGLEEHSPEILKPQMWKGLNILGFTLMEVRDFLQS